MKRLLILAALLSTVAHAEMIQTTDGCTHIALSESNTPLGAGEACLDGEFTAKGWQDAVHQMPSDACYKHEGGMLVLRWVGGGKPRGARDSVVMPFPTVSKYSMPKTCKSLPVTNADIFFILIGE